MEPHRQNTSNIYQHLVSLQNVSESWAHYKIKILPKTLVPLQNWWFQPKDAGPTSFHYKVTLPTANMLLNPQKGCTKKTVYTGGRRLVRGYVCKIMSIIYIKLLCSYLHWHIHQSISISSLQLTKAVIFSKRRFASARADRRHTAAIRPIFWWQVCQQV